MSALCKPSASREDARLAALTRYDVMDTQPEEAFDRITRLAQKIFRTRFATISLLDGHRQWFKSRQGLALAETPRSEAICDVTVRLARPLVIPTRAPIRLTPRWRRSRATPSSAFMPARPSSPRTGTSSAHSA